MRKLGKIFLSVVMILAMTLGNTLAVTVEGTYEESSNVIEAISIYKNQAESDSLSIMNSWGRDPDYVTDKTIIGGTALKFEMLVNAGPNEFFFKSVDKVEEGVEILKTYDISALKETGYLRMLVYPETELTDFAGGVNLVLYSGDRANASAKQSNIVSIKNQLTLNKWNLVTVPVASFANEEIELSKISRILFQSGGEYADKSLSYYVQNVAFCDEAGLNITKAEYANGSITLNWTPKTITPAQYSVKCNGEELVKTTAATYSYAPSQKGCINEYTIEALNQNGDVIYTSAAKSVFIANPATTAAATVYKSSKPDTITVSTLPNWGVPSYTDENTVIGGKSMKWSMYGANDNQLKIELAAGSHINAAQAAENNGYMRMLIYPKTELASLPGKVSTFFYGKNKNYPTSSPYQYVNARVVDITNQLTLNKWNIVEVPMTEFAKDNEHVDVSDINQVWLRAYGDYAADSLVLYVQDIAFYTDADVKISSATYNNGKVTLKWTSTADAANYVIKCNGKEIAEKGGTINLAIITPETYGEVVSYTVEAVDTDGNVIAASDERLMFIENKNDVAAKKVTVFGTSKGTLSISTLPNYGGYKAYTGNTPLGGEAITLSVYSKATIDQYNWGGANGLKIETPTEKIDASADEIGGYMRMLIYPETQLSAFPGDIVTAIYSKDASGVKQSNVITINDKLEMNKWNTVTIPVSELLGEGNQGVDMSNITQIAINMQGNYANDGDCVFYVQGIEFGTTAEVHANGITAVKNGNNVTFTAKVNNLSAADATPALIAVAYNANGSLADIKVFDKTTISAGAMGTVSGEITLPSNTTYKAMLVTDISSMRPMTKAVEEPTETVE